MKIKPIHVCKVREPRFIEPQEYQELPSYRVKYDNAAALAERIGKDPGRWFVVLDGKFIFGDFIEAWIVLNNWEVEDLTISTLSMSQENVDSLANLINGNFVKSLNLIVSHYFFANERHRDVLMPYLYEQLDVDGRLQVAVASVHTKIALIRTKCGRKITIHGSANLRTSSNIEQIMIEDGEQLYDFNKDFHQSIVDTYKTINKAERRTNLWQAVLAAEKAEAAEKPQKPTQPKLANENPNAKSSAW